MPGFYVSNRSTVPKLKNMYPNRCVEESFDVDGYICARNTLNKFMADKLFENTEHYVLIIEGVILNKCLLMEKYDAPTWKDTLQAMVTKGGEAFFKELEGPFSGAVYDKGTEEWRIFTNQTGETPIFYYYDAEKDSVLVASQVNYITDNLKHGSLHLDYRAAVDMLTFAFMEANETYAAEIKRLRGGEFLCIKQGCIELKTYHTFEKNKYDLSGMSTAEIIDAMDAKFRNAVKLEFDKDDEYGYEHLVDLSGGLDSRMTSWVAHSLGHTKQQNITYCQANSDDELIAKQIAAELQHELLVKPLDDISFMYDAEEIVKMNYGFSLYCGITGGNRLLASLNMDKYGIEHTGMLGDVIVGSYLKGESELSLQIPVGMYSSKLASEVKDNYCKTFRDSELYRLYVRGFRGICATHMIRTNYTATWSPFLNTDFFEFCLSIPVGLRCNHGIYKQWILAKYPEAAQFKWEKTGLKVGAPSTIIKLKRLITRGPKKLARMMHLRIFGSENVGMNPIDYWLHKDAHLQKWLMEKFERDMKKMPKSASPQLISDMTSLFLKGTALEKSMAMTVANACAYYFSGVANK